MVGESTSHFDDWTDNDPEWASVHALIKSAFHQLPAIGEDDYIDDDDDNFPDDWYDDGNAYQYRPKRNKRDVWIVTTKPFKGAHFATFPTDLIEPCINAGCPIGGIVLDPFFGSGTVGVVASKLDRRFIGIDINADYCRMAESRLSGST